MTRLARLVFGAAAAALLIVLGLGGLVTAPIAVGWQPRVILTTSMAPALRPGDVVVTSPPTSPVGPGRLVTVADPSRLGGSYTHRVVRLTTQAATAGGPTGAAVRIVTKGDNNPSEDFPAVDPTTVVGQARYVVPMVGLPAVWWHQRDLGPLALSAVLAWAVVMVVVRGSLRIRRAGSLAAPIASRDGVGLRSR